MKLRIRLRSDAAFGRGDGVAGLVDSEIEHDARTGFPYIKGRTIKGLLVESCADILYALKEGNNPALTLFETSAAHLFGLPGSTLEDSGSLHVGKAQLPADFREYMLAKYSYSPQQLLQAFTTIRHQTAVNPLTDTPLDASLRATRVVLRETVFYSNLHAIDSLSDTDIMLLAGCAAGIKRGGQNRTRGLGWLDVSLVDIEGDALGAFTTQIGGAS